jgi:hypothetical protein
MMVISSKNVAKVMLSLQQRHYSDVSLSTTSLYIYYMISPAIYQNIFHSVTGKPWSVMSPSAEAEGRE